MANFARAAFAAAVIGFGPFITAAPLMADEYDFKFTSIDPGLLDGSGTFDVIGGNIDSVSGNFTSIKIPNVSFSVNQASINSTYSVLYGIDADFFSNEKLASNEFEIMSTTSNMGGKFGSSNEQAQGTFAFHGTDVVDDTPGSFFASTTGEPGGGSSGNAPSPEVNTIVGLLVVGGTVAFLRRRRGGNVGLTA